MAGSDNCCDKLRRLWRPGSNSWGRCYRVSGSSIGVEVFLGQLCSEHISGENRGEKKEE